MNLNAAKSMLVQDRMDWRKPHVSWLSGKFYRFFSNERRG